LATQAGVDDLPTNAELAAALATADDAVLAQLALVKAKTDNLPPDPADASDIAASFNALGLAVADIPNNAELAAALDAIATATEVADAILRRNVAGGSDGVRTVSEALYALRNKTEIIGGFLKVYQTDDATVAWQGAVTTAPGDPLTSIDPA
jgi:hypothetical protein